MHWLVMGRKGFLPSDDLTGPAIVAGSGLDDQLRADVPSRAEGTVLCQSSHVLGNWQAGDRLTDWLTDLQRMTLAAVDPKSLGVMRVALRRAVGIVQELHWRADLLQQPLGSFCHATLPKPPPTESAEL